MPQCGGLLLHAAGVGDDEFGAVHEGAELVVGQWCGDEDVGVGVDKRDDDLAYAGVGVQWADELGVGECRGEPVYGGADGLHGVEIFAPVGGDEDDILVGCGDLLQRGVGVGGLQGDSVKECVDDGVAGDSDICGGEVLVEEVLS